MPYTETRNNALLDSQPVTLPVSQHAMDVLVAAVHEKIGNTGLPPGWDWENANLAMQHDWALLQAAFLLTGKNPPVGDKPLQSNLGI